MCKSENWELHLKAALISMRGTIESLAAAHISPKAIRVAIYYLKFIDDVKAKKQMSWQVDARLKDLAYKLSREPQR